MAGFLSFTNMIGHRSTEPIMATWRGEREIGESEMNNYKRHKPITNTHHPCHPRSKVTLFLFLWQFVNTFQTFLKRVFRKVVN